MPLQSFKEMKLSTEAPAAPAAPPSVALTRDHAGIDSAGKLSS